MKKIILPFLSALIGLTVCLVGAELAFRIAGPEVSIVPTVYDEEVGIINQPGYCGVYRLEGRSTFCVNSQGWRDRERPIEKSPGTIRLAIIGDSYIEALQVDMEKALASRLEDRLNKASSGPKFEALSFGKSGFNAANAYLALKSKVLPYKPDLVIYAFLSGNDLQDAVRELNPLPWQPYFRMEKGRLLLDDSFKAYARNSESRPGRALILTLRSHSKLFSYLLYETYPRLLGAMAGVSGGAPASAEPGLSGLEIYREPPAGDLYAEAWNVTERLILEMARECEKAAAGFMVVGITNSLQVTREQREKIPAGYDPFYPENRMMEFGRRETVNYLPLAMEFAELNERRNLIFHGSAERPVGHWNALAHDMAAELIARRILDNPQSYGGGGKAPVDFRSPKRLD